MQPNIYYPQVKNKKKKQQTFPVLAAFTNFMKQWKKASGLIIQFKAVTQGYTTVGSFM